MIEGQENVPMYHTERLGRLVLKCPDIVRLNDGTLLVEQRGLVPVGSSFKGA